MIAGSVLCKLHFSWGNFVVKFCEMFKDGNASVFQGLM